MGFFDLFKRKKESKLDALMKQHMLRLFPGGAEQLKTQVETLKNMLPECDKNDLQGTLCYMTSLLDTSRDRSSHRVVVQGAMNRPDNKFSYEQNMMLYTFAAKEQLTRMIPSLKSMDAVTREQIIREGLVALGNNPNGCTTDEIPTGYGEFGLVATNPVPVRGTGANEIYLESLLHDSGKAIKWERIGSTGVSNIEYPIDYYAISDTEGNELAVIYISPYQNVISSKAPKGFTIKK